MAPPGCTLRITSRNYKGLQDKIKIVAIDLADRPAWYKEKIYPENKVGLLNVDGFYDPLLLFIDLAVNEGFITEEARHIIISVPTAKELVMKLEGCVPEYKIGLVWEDQNQKQNKPGP